MKKYGQIISKLRKKQGLTQEQLGKKLNVSYQAVSKWENDLSEPDLQTLEKLTEIFEISMSEFFDLVKNPEYIDNIEKVKEKENASESKNFIKTKPWFLVLGLGVLIVILSLCAFLIPVYYSSSKIYNIVDPSVFCITAEGTSTKQAGSGFFINNTGLAVTNYHVIENCNTGEIQLNNGKTYRIKSIIGCDEDKDIAIIQIDIKKSKGVKLGNSNKIKVGDVVYAIGYPESFQLGSVNSTFTQGIISKTSYNYKGQTYIQTTVDMTRGNSGGVLINQQGYVIGITTLMITNGLVDYMNMAIPINKINDVKRDINKSLSEYYEMHKTFCFYSDGEIIGRKNFKSGDKITKIEDPTKIGYTFGGWYTDSNFETLFDFDTPVVDQIACHAKWIPNKYTIRFDANGGEGTMDDVVATYDKQLTLPSNLFQLKHYNFMGWKQQESEVLFENCDNVKNLTTENNGLIILNALWKIQNYTIKFDGNNSNDGTMENITIEYDQKINLPSNQFTKTGYLFNGWNYNGQNYQDNQEVSKLCETEGIIELKANWKPISYTIKFTFENQSYNQTFVYDESKKLSPNSFSKEYFNFVGWSCVALAKNFKDEEEILNLTQLQGEVFTFVAQFQEYTYSIRYNPQHEIDLENSEIITYRYSQESAPSFMFRKTGYKFIHWIDDNGKIYERKYVVKNGVGTWTTTTFCKLSAIDKDIINFYAVWEEITYNVYYKYNLKTGTKYTDIGTKTYEEKFVLISPEYVDDGYEFLNWEIYSETYLKNETVSKLTWTNKSTVYIVAKYQPKQYVVNFNGNGEASGEMLPIYATFDQEVIIPKNSFIKDGYTFVGWQFNDKFYATTNIGIPISTYSDNITLTACWVENLKGEGTFENPYTIQTKKDLDTFAKLSTVNQFENCYVSLTNDIDCEYAKLNEISFAGTFEGNGHKLINVDYANGALFKENSGIIRNLSIENLKIEINNEDATQNTYIAGLVKYNKGYISSCCVKGSISVQSVGNITIYGLVGSTSGMLIYGQIEFCFTELNVDIMSDSNINTCKVYGFGGGNSYAVDYNYSILNLTANLKTVNNLTINSFGDKNNHSFSQANIDVKVDEVTNYNFNQTVSYYSDDSSIKLKIGGKSVPNLVETTQSLSNLKNKDWMENNLFKVKGVWVYDSEHLPTLSFTHQIIIDTQEQFIALNDSVLFGEYILNCDIDLSEKTYFSIRENYGVFNGNGHIIKNYTLKKNEYKNLYVLFQKNCGIIKNLGLENLDIDVTITKDTLGTAGLVYENYGIVNSCFVKGSISASNSGNVIAGGIVAISKGGKILNSYSDVSISATTTSNMLASCYAGGIVATGNAIVENCFSIKSVFSYAHYAKGETISAYGISGADGIVKNSFVLSDVTVSKYSSSGNFQIGGIGKEYENSFAYEWQTIKKLEEDLSFGNKSYEEFCSKSFLESLNFKLFISKEDLLENNNNVWIVSEKTLPKLWFEI